nr:putative integron gene cassette protein [uncultured bacterium]
MNSGVRPLSRVPVIFLILFLASCATAPLSYFSSDECESSGGTVSRLGHFILACQWPTTDAGHACTSSTECQGYCALPSTYWKEQVPGISVPNLPSERPLQGICSNFQPEKRPNCGISIEKGLLERWACID